MEWLIRFNTIMLELTYWLQAALTSCGEKADWLHESTAVDTQSLSLKNPLCTTNAESFINTYGI